MENTELEIIEDTNLLPANYLQDKALIDIQVSTAHAFPRNIKRAVDNAIAIVTMDEKIARSCTYAVPRGGKNITGPSTHLANILSQCWGNMRVESKVVEIGNKQITSEGIAWDLESNLAKKAQVKRPITGKTGRFSEDMITVTGNAANSIASRNAIFAVIPRGFVDKVYSAAIQAMTGDISDESKLIGKRKKVIDGLIGAYNVTEAEIVAAIGKASVSHIDGDDLVVLIGIGTAIKDGDTTVEQAFRGAKTSEVGVDLAELEKLFEKVKGKMGDDEKVHALRIMDAAKPEKGSFDKLKISMEKLLNK